MHRRADNFGREYASNWAINPALMGGNNNLEGVRKI